MIFLRCWYCNKQYACAESRIGEKIPCSCGKRCRIPKRSGGGTKSLTCQERLIEMLVYGCGGAFLAFCMAPMSFQSQTLFVRLGIGFAIGSLGGERGINWIGRRIRARGW